MSENEFRAEGTLEIREGAEGQPTVLVGTAPPWDKWSERGRLPYRERFMRGAFTNLEDPNIVATIQHDDAAVIGKTKAGTLRLFDTPEGLRYEVDLPDTQKARDLAANIRAGNIDASSFEFRPPKDELDEMRYDNDLGVTRTIHPGATTLRQVGPVTLSAYEGNEPISLRCEQKVAELTAPKQDEGAARERRSQIREAELALAESELSA